MREDDAKKPKDQELELTRREWLLKLGEAAVLFGFGGAIDEAPMEAASRPALATLEVSVLPPGLYEPSYEHLRHALSNERPFHPVPAGSQTDYLKLRSGSLKPRFFSPREFQMVERIVELMLGEPSSAPGASKHEAEVIRAVVAEWVDLAVFSSAAVREAAWRLAPDHRALAIAHYGADAVSELETADPQQVCREGLRWLEEECGRRYGAGFLHLTSDQQLEMLKLVSEDRADRSARNAGTELFRLMKAEIIRGFYTSRPGLNELDYKGNAFYAECPGCEE